MSTLRTRAIFLATVAASHTALVACGGPGGDRERVLLVTTTSVEASGLLDELLEAYHAYQESYRLAPTAVGSGAALEMGRRGDADLLLTHDPEGEAHFIAEGHAAGHGPLMMNRFLIAGPPEDPAGVAGADDPVAGMRRIVEAGAGFVSRGDDSGTHARELALWREAGIAPRGTRPGWYVEAGTGMGETLQMASQLAAYTLTDRGTFLHLRASLRLEPLLERGDGLDNHYTWILPRDPENPDGARDLLAWLRGPGQAVIAGYGAEAFGEPLFRPTAGDTATSSAADSAPAAAR